MYQPKIRDEQIHELYLLKEKTRRPMTVLIREAVDKYLVEQGERLYVVKDKRVLQNRKNRKIKKIEKEIEKLLKMVKEVNDNVG